MNTSVLASLTLLLDRGPGAEPGALPLIPPRVLGPRSAAARQLALLLQQKTCLQACLRRERRLRQQAYAVAQRRLSRRFGWIFDLLAALADPRPDCDPIRFGAPRTELTITVGSGTPADRHLARLVAQNQLLVEALTAEQRWRSQARTWYRQQLSERFWAALALRCSR